jgi:RNA polymerase sigma factor (sigma-70 family)
VRIFDDENIIEGIKNRDNTVLEFVYKKYFPLMKWKLIYPDSFTEEDAKDIFQDAMIIIYQKIKDDHFALTHSFQTYLFGICRIIIIKRLKMKQDREEINFLDCQDIIKDDTEDIDSEQLINEMELNKEIKKGLVRKYFYTLSEICRKVLKMYADDIPFKVIADKLGINNADTAMWRKHWCKEQLVKKIKDDKLYQTLLTKEKHIYEL